MLAEILSKKEEESDWKKQLDIPLLEIRKAKHRQITAHQAATERFEVRAIMQPEVDANENAFVTTSVLKDSVKLIATLPVTSSPAICGAPLVVTGCVATTPSQNN